MIRLLQCAYSALLDSRIIHSVTWGYVRETSRLGRLSYYNTVILKSEGLEILGAGVSTSSRIATVKAFGEAVERFACQNIENFNSAAFHYNPAVLRKNVLAEALERDALIRWTCGANPPVRRQDYGEYFTLDILTRDPRFTMVACVYPLNGCYAFGTACDQIRSEAENAAKNELIMSLIRHEQQGCQTPRLHDQLHQRTRLPTFESVLEPQNISSRDNWSYKIEIAPIPGPTRWPMEVHIGRSAELLKWSPQTFLDPEFSSYGDFDLVQKIGINLTRVAAG